MSGERQGSEQAMKTEYALTFVTKEGVTLAQPYETSESFDDIKERARQEVSFGAHVVLFKRQVTGWEPIGVAGKSGETE